MYVPHCNCTRSQNTNSSLAFKPRRFARVSSWEGVQFLRPPNISDNHPEDLRFNFSIINRWEYLESALDSEKHPLKRLVIRILINIPSAVVVIHLHPSKIIVRIFPLIFLPFSIDFLIFFLIGKFWILLTNWSCASVANCPSSSTGSISFLRWVFFKFLRPHLPRYFSIHLPRTPIPYATLHFLQLNQQFPTKALLLEYQPPRCQEFPSEFLISFQYACLIFF